MKIFLLLFLIVVVQQVVGQHLQVGLLVVSASDNAGAYLSEHSVLAYKENVKTINLHLDVVDDKSQNSGSAFLIMTGVVLVAGSVIYLLSQQLSFVNSLGESKVNKKGVLLGLGFGGGLIVGGIALQTKNKTK